MWIKKWIGFIVLIGMICLNGAQTVLAESQGTDSKVLIYYDEESKKSYAQIVANLAGHFNQRIDQLLYNDRETADLSKYQYILYITGDHTSIPAGLKAAVEGSKKPFFVIGSPERSEQTESIIEVKYNNQSYPVKDQFVYPMSTLGISQTFATATNGLTQFPLVTRNGNEWHYLSNQLWGVMGNIFADVLHDFFNQPHHSIHDAFIRIEDVHPETDPQKLKDIADYLHSKGIPFMVAVIPVYYNPKDDTYLTLDQSPSFKDALQYMVQKGGSIILHGYSHQHYKRETGEGFEFWDIERDKPITNEEGYDRDKLEKGIAMLVRNGLEPVAFEPPHYTMSQNGYRLLSQYFSTLVGQLQLSDDTFQTTQKPPYRLSRDVNGLTIIPETLGYVSNDNYYMDAFKSNMKETMIVRDSVAGAFYHPYLPLDKLKHLVEWLQTYPIDFIDLKTEKNSVHTDFVNIQSGPKGIGTQVTNPKQLTSLGKEDEKPSFLSGVFLYVFWGIVTVVSVFTLIFIVHLSNLRRKSSSRLFQERDMTG